MRFVPFPYLDRHRLSGLCLILGALLFASVASATPPSVIEHAMTVSVTPKRHQVEVRDTLTLPDTITTPIRIWLGSAFTPTVAGGTLRRLDATSDGRFRSWALQPDGNSRRLTLEYAGTIENRPRSASHGMPTAWVDETGVYLDGASGWVPRIDGDAVRFSLSIKGPEDWTWLSQGDRSDDGRHWTSTVPQDDIYLLGGTFARQAETHGALTLETYLLTPDPALSSQYLSVMGGYTDFFSALIGAYPYPRFAVVENRWQTGYGMPGFTLLGSQVMRLPFILHSSLPHEILHNWWGNGVWIDAREGNWSEGLTAYLADHLIKEANSGGAEYRRKLLERYTSFAGEGRDIALRDFRSRHSDATQAVGYGKMLMLYHMQRREMGDAAFVGALRTLWQEKRFQFARMDEVLDVLANGKPSDAFAPAWLNAPGAPQLAIESVDAPAHDAQGHRLSIHLRQTQTGAPYPLTVPLVVQTADGTEHMEMLRFKDGKADWAGTLSSAPVRVDVDPFFDVFRRLDPAEQPPSLARLFGAETQWLVLPAQGPSEQIAAWQRFAEAWQARFGNVKTVSDDALARLPENAIIWVLGWNNRALPTIQNRLDGPDQRLDGTTLIIQGEPHASARDAVVVLDTDNRRPPLGFIGAVSPTDIDGLARKLPHYSTYGRLIFASGTLQRKTADTLPVSHSPLSVVIGDQDPGPPTDRRAPLAAQVKAPLPSQR